MHSWETYDVAEAWDPLGDAIELMQLKYSKRVENFNSLLSYMYLRKTQKD